MKNLTLILLLFVFFGCSHKNVQQEPYSFVEQMPSFPGGEAEMYRFINQNLRLSEEYYQQMSFSTAIRFVVARTGEIKDIEPAKEKYAGEILTDSLISVIKRMPRWNPGKHNGQAVDVYYTIPLHISPTSR